MVNIRIGVINSMRRFAFPAVQDGLKFALQWAHVRVRDMESLTRKIHKVTTSGPSKLMVSKP